MYCVATQVLQGERVLFEKKKKRVSLTMRWLHLQVVIGRKKRVLGKNEYHHSVLLRHDSDIFYACPYFIPPQYMPPKVVCFM